MIGKTLGHYEILARLGAGGMGAVYRARDTNLRRDVAIKVLPEALANDENRLARLRREAQLLASVNHPNIAAIYNLEESEGTRWLVLELVEGTTLEQELRSGPLSVGDSLRIGVQMAAALEAAHEKGIVHRDLKAANVMLDARRRVKVLDFGIAKDVSGGEGAQSDAETVTRLTADFTADGVVIGTAPYMSPEQVRGRPVDKRSDNWSFGCLMFELLTGRRPFDRDTMMDTMSAVLEHEPDWDLLPADTPEDMEGLIRRCLRKDAEVRLHDIADVRVQFGEIETAVTGAPGVTAPRRRRTAAASAPAGWPAMKVAATFVGGLAIVGAAGLGLWSVAGGERGTSALPPLVIAPVPDIPAIANAIAVLPFVGIPDEAANRSFAAGMADHVLTHLMKVSDLRPVGGTSTLKAAGLARQELGRQLGVSKVLEGSVQRDGNALLVNVRLIDATDGKAIFTQDFPGTFDLGSIFDIQRGIATQVAHALTAELVGDEAGAQARYPTASRNAYDAYVQGRESLRTRTKVSLEAARASYRQAVALDSGYALAHVGVADANVLLAQYGGLTEAERSGALLEAQASVDSARGLDPGLGEAFKAQGALYLLNDNGRAGPALQLATERNPNDALAHNYYGSYLMYQERDTKKAWAEFERAHVLDPLDAPPVENLARILLEDGRLDEALSMATEAVRLDEDYPMGHWVLGEVLLNLGRGDLALEHFDKMAELNSYDDIRLRYVAEAYEAVGKNDEAEKVHLRRVEVEPENPNRYVKLGDFYRDVGRFDEAAASYTRAIALGDRTQAFKSRMVTLELDRGDVATAERLMAEIDAVASNAHTGVARFNLDMYHGRLADSAEAAGRVAVLTIRGQPYTDLEPVGYLALLVDRPADGRQFFQANFPALIADDDPSINGDNLRWAIDLAAVLMHTGEQARADLLLRKSEAFVKSVADVQRRNQFRAAPMEIYALQGRTADALAALRVAIDNGWRNGWWRLEHKPHFESLRGNPTFQAMVAELRAAVTR